eukprot:TRINITY_DN52396_c0_g1_i1.p1 TRINITY_DN52396_c0_g1~~TRINITY_DN52396_c0_g1_i1.p1  ORF type:complete len:341 (+),score=131.42 TRINITY_DN52396_c0_g1_i1:82-1023(+)
MPSTWSSWFRSHGGAVPANKNDDKTMLRVPVQLLINVHAANASASFSEHVLTAVDGLDDEATVILFLLHELGKGTESTWYPFFECVDLLLAENTDVVEAPPERKEMLEALRCLYDQLFPALHDAVPNATWPRFVRAARLLESHSDAIRLTAVTGLAQPVWCVLPVPLAVLPHAVMSCTPASWQVAQTDELWHADLVARNASAKRAWVHRYTARPVDDSNACDYALRARERWGTDGFLADAHLLPRIERISLRSLIQRVKQHTKVTKRHMQKLKAASLVRDEYAMLVLADSDKKVPLDDLRAVLSCFDHQQLLL